MKKLQFLKAGDDMKTITRAKYLDRIIEADEKNPTAGGKHWKTCIFCVK